MKARKRRSRKRAAKKNAKKHTKGATVNKDLTKADKKEVAKASSAASDWGVDIDAVDIEIPKISIMQAMSKSVLDKASEAQIGEFRLSTTNEKVAETDGFEAIPFHVDKLWYVSDYVTDKKGKRKAEFNRVEAQTPENSGHKFETETERWQKVLNFYYLLPGELEDDAALPYVTSFKGTSYRAGKSLLNQMYVKSVKAHGRPFGAVIKISAREETNDDGTFMVLQTAPVREADKAELELCAEWNNMVRTMRVAVDESEETGKREQGEEVEVKF